MDPHSHSSRGLGVAAEVICTFYKLFDSSCRSAPYRLINRDNNNSKTIYPPGRPIVCDSQREKTHLYSPHLCFSWIRHQYKNTQQTNRCGICLLRSVGEVIESVKKTWLFETRMTMFFWNTIIHHTLSLLFWTLRSPFWSYQTQIKSNLLCFRGSSRGRFVGNDRGRQNNKEDDLHEQIVNFSRVLSSATDKLRVRALLFLGVCVGWICSTKIDESIVILTSEEFVAKVMSWSI